MSTESESEQYASNSEGEEEQDSESESGDQVDSEAEESDSEDEADSEEEDEADSKEEVDSDSDMEQAKKSKASKTAKKIPFDQPKGGAKTSLIEKYEELKGKSLFVRFPHVLPTEEADLDKTVKSICSGIIKVRRPRQKSARYCLIDFDNEEDRRKAMTELKNVQIDNKKLHFELPKTEKEDYVKKIMEMRGRRKAERSALAKLKRAANKKKDGKVEKTYTSTLILKNIPAEVTDPEIKKMFPNAIDVKVTAVKGNQDQLIGTVTFPTPQDASKAKRKKYKCYDTDLNVSFATKKKGKNKAQLKKRKQMPGEANGQTSNASPKGGKRKLEKTSNTETSSPKKKMKNINKTSGKVKPVEIKKKDKDLEVIEKKKFKNELRKIIANKGKPNPKDNKAGVKATLKKKDKNVQKIKKSSTFQKNQQKRFGKPNKNKNLKVK